MEDCPPNSASAKRPPPPVPPAVATEVIDMNAPNEMGDLSDVKGDNLVEEGPGAPDSNMGTGVAHGCAQIRKASSCLTACPPCPPNSLQPAASSPSDVALAAGGTPGPLVMRATSSLPSSECVSATKQNDPMVMCECAESDPCVSSKRLSKRVAPVASHRR